MYVHMSDYIDDAEENSSCIFGSQYSLFIFVKILYMCVYKFQIFYQAWNCGFQRYAFMGWWLGLCIYINIKFILMWNGIFATIIYLTVDS